jgi:hypothetical protein
MQLIELCGEAKVRRIVEVLRAPIDSGPFRNPYSSVYFGRGMPMSGGLPSLGKRR